MSDTERLLNHQDMVDINSRLNTIAMLMDNSGGGGGSDPDPDPDPDPGPDYSVISWSSSTDGEIVDAISALDSGTITVNDLSWAVGDERAVRLNSISAGSYNVDHAAQNNTLVILDKRSYNGVGHYVVGFKKCLEEPEVYASSGSPGWHNSYARSCCAAIFNMIPTPISNIFKTFTVYSAEQGNINNPGLISQTGKLALAAVKEVDPSYSGLMTANERDSEYISQFEYYKTTANRIKSNADGLWFLRTPDKSHAGRQCEVMSDADIDTVYNDYPAGFAPFGVI